MASRQVHEFTVGAFVALLESIPDAVAVVDADGLIVLVNAQLEGLLGYPRSQLLGRSIDTLLPLPARDRHQASRTAYLAHPTQRQMAESLEPMARRSDGTELPVDVTLQPIDVHPPLVAAFVRDASVERARRLRESDLAARLLHAEKLETIGQYASAIAHDFNNLLTVISADADSLASFPDAEVRGRAAEIIGLTERGATLTQQLLRSSRQSPSRREVLDLGEAVRDAEWILRRLAGSGHLLVVEITPGLGSIRAERNQLEQVLFNLVINARDAMAEGGRIVVSVSIANDDPSSVALSVADTGAGMEPEVAKHAFEPFFTTKERGGGVGLGLFSVAEIVERNGGRIELTSEPGVGTTFVLTFPIVQDTVGDAALERGESSGATRS